FQLSKLVEMGLRVVRQALRLPPWEAIVPGEAYGTLVQAATLADVETRPGPVILMLDHADGDAEIPAGVKGIVLGHSLPHLSHLGVRARQARVPFAAAESRELLRAFAPLAGKTMRLRVTPDGPALKETAPLPSNGVAAPPATAPAVVLPETVLATEGKVLP